jgi:hypothetical protein
MIRNIFLKISNLLLNNFIINLLKVLCFLKNKLFKNHQSNFISLKELEHKINSIINEIGFDECRYYKDNRPFITFGKILYEHKGNPVELVPFVLISNKQYDFGNTERGEIIDEHFSTDYHDVIYWFFEGLAFIAGKKFWRQEHETNLDQRRYFFKKQLEILYKIDSEYGERCKNKLIDIIKRHPFEDGFPETLDFLDQYLIDFNANKASSDNNFNV